MYVNNENQKKHKIEKMQASFLGDYEIFFIKKISRITPSFIKSYHLTLTTILWIMLVIFFSFLAKYNNWWLLASSVVMIFHSLTDALDVEIEKIEKRTIKHWNFYMDHLLDYFFLIAIITGYSIVIPAFNGYILVLSLVVSCGFMTNSFLYLATVNKFKISHFNIGPLEVKFLFIAINLMIIFTKDHYVIFFIKLLTICLFAILTVIVYKNQHELRKEKNISSKMAM